MPHSERFSPFHPLHICFRAPNWVGDIVMATPTFRCVRNSFPQAHITVVVANSVTPVLKCAPWLDDTITYDRSAPQGLRSVNRFMEAVAGIRSRMAHLGIILPNSFSSALMMRLGCVRRRIGYIRDARQWLLTDAIPRPQGPDGTFKPTYMVDYYLGLCEALGLNPSDRRTELKYSPADLRSVQDILRSHGLNPKRPLFLLHATAGYGPSKLWPEQYFADLAGRLQSEYGAQMAGIGAPDASSAIQRIDAQSPADVTDLTRAGIDLHLLKPLVATSDLMVTTDSGPRHYGVAIGIPTVCVMGPTHPDYSTSQRPHDHVVQVDVDCGPCQKKVCQRDHRCMEQLTPNIVMAACRRALERGHE